MTVSEQLRQTWEAVLGEASQAEGYYHRRIPLTAPWPAHAGIHRPTCERLLLLETDAKAVRGLRLADRTKGYFVEVVPDEAGRSDRTAVRIRETSNAYHGVFLLFCSDLLEHWIQCASATDAVNSLARRLTSWKRFFQRGTTLSREDYIGVYGELSFIEAASQAGVEMLAVLTAWQGPTGANQDFLFGPTAVEIKTATSNEMDSVRITNARQLDPTGLNDLFLKRYAFDFREGTGRTLPQLIVTLKTQISTVSSEALQLFCERLLEAGLLEGTPHDLDSSGFTPRALDTFAVTSGFPRLLESDLPQGISDPSYTLNLSAATSFRMKEEKFWPLIIASHA